MTANGLVACIVGAVIISGVLIDGLYLMHQLGEFYKKESWSLEIFRLTAWTRTVTQIVKKL